MNLDLDRMDSLVSQTGRPGTTHYVDCPYHHPLCAVTALVTELRTMRETVLQLVDGYSPYRLRRDKVNVCMTCGATYGADHYPGCVWGKLREKVGR